MGTVESPGPSGDTCKWAARREWNGYPCHSSCEKTRGCLSNAHAGSCDCATCADDVLFIERLLGELESTMCIARSRVFITGFSNGGMMAFQLAQSRIANRFAAIVTVGASPLLGFGAEPTVPMPLMEIHGSADKIIPANVTGQSGPGGSTISSDGCVELYQSPIHRFSHTDNSSTIESCAQMAKTFFPLFQVLLRASGPYHGQVRLQVGV